MSALICCIMVLAQLVKPSAQLQERQSGNIFYKPQVHFQTDDCPGKPLFLTPFIEAGLIKEAQLLSRVKPDIGGMPSYSGFLTVNKQCGSNLFFWYFPAQQHSETAPLVTWLQGGPGSTSMFGLFQQVGPLNYFPEGMKIRQFSWNVKNNLVFFDQPVGTGFSFTTRGCYAKNGTMVGIDMYNALVQFLTLFPDLQNSKFILTGESYAGHYIPTTAYTIHQRNPSAKVKINLYGMMIGGGWSDPKGQIKYADYVYQLGIVDKSLKMEMESYQRIFMVQVDKEEWDKAFETMHLILEIPRKMGVNIYNILPQENDLNARHWSDFIHFATTRKSIHVGETDFFKSSTTAYWHLKTDIVQSVKPLVEQLLEHYIIMFYAGQVDVICGYPMMINFLRSLKWSGQQQYLSARRAQWVEAGQLAGYVKGQHHLYDVMVRAAGHLMAVDQPFWIYQLVNAFTSGNISSLFSNYEG